MALHVGFGWRAAEDAGIGVDEGQILALPVAELLSAEGRRIA